MAETISNANAATSTLFLGHNGEWWDFWLIVSAFTAVAVAAAIGFTTAGSLVSHKREAVAAERALNSYKLETRKQISEAKARAKEAELALERLKAPRVLSPQQQTELVQLMKQFTGTPIRVWTSPGTSDTAPLANVLAEIFRNATLSVGTATSLSGRTFPGVIVANRTGSNGRGCAEALVGYLNNSGISAVLGPESPDDGGLMPAANLATPSAGWQPDVFVIVGSKI